jgi:hypothetical protein
MSSATNLIVIAFLVLVIVWLFVRRGEAGDRIFLAVASLIYIAGMAATYWVLGAEKGKLIRSLVLETIGMGLVMLSRRIKKNSK